jgi:hypothetical protein
MDKPDSSGICGQDSLFDTVLSYPIEFSAVVKDVVLFCPRDVLITLKKQDRVEKLTSVIILILCKKNFL